LGLVLDDAVADELDLAYGGVAGEDEAVGGAVDEAGAVEPTDDVLYGDAAIVEFACQVGD
jgi:hypothetical protein